ncbi:SAM-dependent methyltransferase [Ottowia sp.]|uniref:SAM-dependent methyltransferase n=1 Tax=Ottowia sp. TaxID=1898956 RepID=UPI003A890DC5
MSTSGEHAIHPGILYLVPTPLDHGCDTPAPITDALPQGTLQVAARLTHWVSENAKSTRAFLKRVDAVAPLAQPLQALSITELPRAVHKKGDHNGTPPGFDARALLAPAVQGHDVGLVSEAGIPAVADPGSSVVRAAHDLNIRVVPLVGPVSLLLALAASGLNGQHFAFVGYLPQEESERARQLQHLEATALKTGQAQLFIETPYRNPALVRTLLAHLAPTTRLAVCSGITMPQASAITRTVQQWCHRPDDPALHTRLPTVFALGR